MPAALFYELMTTSEEVRRECFRKFSPIDTPVLLVEHIGTLLRHEVDYGSPAGLPSSHCLEFPFRFNPGLNNEDYSLPGEALEVLKEEAVAVEAEIDRLITYSESINQLFPGLLRGKASDQAAARRDAYANISDLSWINEFYGGIRGSSSVHPCPDITSEHFKWAHIRWLQVNLLFAVDLHIRHGGNLRRNLTPALWTRLEHDVHDAQVLAFGVLEGELATYESKLKTWQSLLHGSADAKNVV